MNNPSRTEVEKAENLSLQIHEALAESDEAMEVVIDSFLRLSKSVCELLENGCLNDSGAKRANQILAEVPRIITALQFQDRLKQRLDHITETLHIISRGRDEEGYVQRRAEDALSRFGTKVSRNPLTSEDDSITLFADAA